MEDEILFRILKKHIGGTWVRSGYLLLIVQFVGSYLFCKEYRLHYCSLVYTTVKIDTGNHV